MNEPMEFNPEMQAKVRNEICNKSGMIVLMKEWITDFRFPLIEGTSQQGCRQLIEGLLSVVDIPVAEARAYLTELSVEPCCCTEHARKMLIANPKLMQKGPAHESACSCGRTLKIMGTEANKFCMDIKGLPLDIRPDPFQIAIRCMRIMLAEKCLSIPVELNRLSVCMGESDGLIVREELIRIL